MVVESAGDRFSHNCAMSDPEDDIYDGEVERQWGESTSISGIDPEMLDEQIESRASRRQSISPAAFSPWLIPYAAISTSPLIAAFLALFADGDPPSPREAIALVSTGFAAWIANMGFTVTTIGALSPTAESAIRFGVLVVDGAALWALYTFWMKGDRALDRSGLRTTVVVMVVLSGLFWVGRGAEWWVWMGR